MIKIKLPEYIEEAVYQIESKGFEAFVVGGAVRDALLGMEPSDWDIATNALPEVVKSIFSHHYDTGIKHGTVTVLVNEIPIEITTYRKEGKYTDFRRPESVTFSGSLEDDLKRRDFTINALAYNNTSGIVDISSGIDDLKLGIIRCIGDPAERLSEDALRMLRAVRLSLLLDFKIEDQTYEPYAALPNLLIKKALREFAKS
jgi:tRNA nucleotidyltransferase (CCA-adding enzyme)